MHDTLSIEYGSCEPYPTLPCRPRPKDRKRSPDLQPKNHIRELAGSIEWLRSLRAILRVIVVAAQFTSLIPVSALVESRAGAQTASHPPSIDQVANFVTEASTRFAVPALWIRAIIQIESAGDEHTISPRGAMGLMQLMPSTWVDLSARYGPVSIRLIRAIIYWLAPRISGSCTIASDRQAASRPTTRIRHGMNSTSQRANHFLAKPSATSQQ